MIAERPYILYSLPQSRITQALRGGRIETVWTNIHRFLTTCTSADISVPKSIYLTGFTADDQHGETPELAENLIRKAKSAFGEGTTEPIGYRYPENTPLKQTKTKWKLTAKDLDRALKFMIELQPLPKYNLGPLELIVSYDFKLIDIDSKEELPNQQYPSSLLIWLTRSNCASPILYFPFSQPDKDFRNYIENTEKLFPFKFDTKYLRLVHSNKKGTANMFSKL